MKEKISIIIINYHAADFIGNLLKRLADNPPQMACELIIVDNSTPTEHIDVPRGMFTTIQQISMERNVGYAPAAARGADMATGEQLLFLNPDTLITGDAIEVLSDFVDRHPQAGAVSPHVRLFDEQSPFYVCCLHLLSPVLMLLDNSILSRISVFSWLLYPEWEFDFRLWQAPQEAIRVPAIIGAIMLIRKSVFQEIGGFDTRFFASLEDADICLRLRQHGYRNYILKQAEAIHFHGQLRKRSQNDPNAQHFLNQEHNMPILYLRKHYGLLSASAYQWFIAFEEVLRKIVKRLPGRDMEQQPEKPPIDKPIVLFLPADGVYLLEMSHSRSFIQKMAAITEGGDFVLPPEIHKRILRRKVYWRVFPWPLPRQRVTIKQGEFVV